MNLDFDKLFKINAIALKINRSHPYIRRDIKWFLEFLIMHGTFTAAFFLVVYNIIYHDLKANNFSQTCKNGVLLVVFMVITFQYCILLQHQDSLLELINNIKKDYKQSKNLSSDERSVVLKYANKGLYVCRVWLVVNVAGCGMFAIKSSVLMIYYYWIDDFKLVPLYDLVYPTFIESNKDNIFVYAFTFSLMSFYACYSSIMYVAFVPLGPIFILHACGQLELVRNRIEDVFVEIDDRVITEKLKFIIERMQYVYSFVGQINDCFKIANELTLKASAIILPITTYEVIEALNHGEVSLEFIVFIVGGILISGSPCHYSNLLMDMGEDIRQSLYSCGWELHYDHRTRTTLQLMLQRALKPAAIETIFRTLCLDTLTDLYQESYAIFNLINAMWN